MPKNNPRSEIMGNILTAFKSVDRRLAELETQSESLHLAAGGRYGAGAPASQALLDEAQSLTSEISSTLSAMKDDRTNLASFLENVKSQMQEVMSETAEMEEFMGQYGWKPKEPIDMSILDWSDKTVNAECTAPAAATEFDEDSSQAVDSEETNKAPSLPSQTKTQTAPSQNPKIEETIFDIGLSEATLKLLLAKNKPSEVTAPPQKGSIAVAHHPPSISQLKLPSSSVPSPALAAFPSSKPSESLNLPDQSDLDDSHVGASPVLELRSKLHCLSSVVDSSLSQSYTGGTEISPGLPRRMTPVPLDESVMQSPSLTSRKLLRKSSKLLLNKTPECPELQTMDVRKLISKNVAEQPVKTTPEEPHLTSQFKSLSTVAKVGTEKEDTPEAPELTHHQQEKTVTGTPETPVLKTIVWKKKF